MATKTSFTSQGKTIQAELYRPAGAAPAGVVIIAYGSDGLVNTENGPWATMIRGYAKSLAASGLVAMIPDYLSVTGTRPGPAVLLAFGKHNAKWQTALSDAIDHAKSLPGVKATKCGLLGFSLGGHLCLRLRAKVKILVEHFAPFAEGIGTNGALTHAQIHHGEADHPVDFSSARAVERTLKGERTSTAVFPYPGAGHGFVGNDPQNTHARTKSKAETLSFFQSHL